jgi:hypothetical protein
MHRNRLEELSALLKARADQRHFAQICGLRVESACRGFAANAIQIAAAHPSFQQQGLRLERAAPSAALVPRFASHEGGPAIEEFFELDSFSAELLFDPESYDEGQLCDPGAVARRIDWLLQPYAVAEHEKQPAMESTDEGPRITEVTAVALPELQFAL